MEHMRRNQKAKFPQSAFAFYIKIYCKRRKESTNTKYTNNLVEATKVWLSLTEEEREQIHKSYEEQKHKYKLQCFNQLKNAEPFLKIKNSRQQNTSLSQCCLVTEESVNAEDIIPQPIDIASETATNFPNPIESEDTNVDIGVIECIMDESQHGSEEHPQLIQKPLLVEPLPPTLKTGKDLFHLLNSMGEANSTWSSLSQSEKRQYSQAVCILKNDYITKFKQYLESLSPRELFDYYNKVVF